MTPSAAEVDWEPVLRWFARPGADLRSLAGTPAARPGIRARQRRGMSLVLFGHRASALEAMSVGQQRAAADVGLPAPGAVVARETSAADLAVLAARLTAALRLGDALTCIRAARDAVGPEPTTRAALQLIEGELRGLMGQPRLAATELLDAAQRLRAEGQAELAGHGVRRALRHLAAHESALPALRAYDRSLRGRTGALELLERQAEHDGWTMELRLAKALLLATDDPHAALAELPPPARGEPPEPDAVAAELLRAELLARTGRLQEARQALEHLQVGDAWWETQRAARLASVLYELGETGAAAAIAERAMGAADELRGRVGDELQRAAWVLPRRAVYDVALRCALDQDDALRCLTIAERARGTALARVIGARARAARAELVPRVAHAFDALVREDRGPLAPGAVGELRTAHARLAAAIAPPVVTDATLRAIGARIGPFTLVHLHELTPASGVRVLATERGVQHADEYRLSEEQVLLTQRTAALTSSADLQWLDDHGGALVGGLGEQLLPVALADRPDGTPVTISPPARLRTLPWGALSLDGAPVIDRFPVVQWPSVALARDLGTDPPGAARPLMLLAADPDGDLDGVREQVARLRERWDARLVVLDGERASAATLRTLSQSGQLHSLDSLLIAGHGMQHPDEPLASGLVMGDGAVLTAAAMLALRWPATVELWTCRSDATSPLLGEEHLGVTASALTGGANRVLMTAWAVDDAAIPALVDRIHAQRRDGRALASAVQHAQRELRTTLPFSAWAAPQVIGLPT